MKISAFGMSFPVFKLQDTAALHTLHNKIIKKFEKGLPLGPGLKRVHFIFLATDDRYYDKFATKLREMNSEILYPHKGRSQQLIGRTQKFEPDDVIIKKYLLDMAATGLKYGFTLEEWRIECDLTTTWKSGLVTNEGE